MTDILTKLSNSELELLASSGHLKAQLERLKRLEKQGRSLDKSEQLEVLRKLAAEKNQEALVRLADIYVKDVKTIGEIDNVLLILEEAQRLGNPQAYYLIAKCYELALKIGTYNEEKTANLKNLVISNYLHAYNLGYAIAFESLISFRIQIIIQALNLNSTLQIPQVELNFYLDKNSPLSSDLSFLRGIVYEFGLGCESSLQNAIKEYEKASKELHFESIYRYSRLTLFKDNALINSSVSDNVAYLLLKSANAGHSGCKYLLSILYENGYEFNKDLMRSEKLLKEAALDGFLPALEKLVATLITNKIKPTDPDFFYMQKAAELEILTAIDYIKNIQLLSKKQIFWNNLNLANRGDLSGMVLLAENFECGEGTDKDLQSAAKWYERAAEMGDRDAQQKMIKWYQHGIGVKVDHNRAKFWKLKSEST